MPEIVKGDGERELFNVLKLADSLVRAGTPVELANTVAERVGSLVKDGMRTDEIYRLAYKLLHKEEKISAARYSIRRAILDLGPTGFPFEDYVSELMRARGYAVKTRQMVRGKCATHEVDIVMQKDGKSIGAELKFHNEAGYKTDIKIALYVRARFTDIHEGAVLAHEEDHIHEGWLITNTKFTDAAVHYAMCSGIHLLGLDYPMKGNLADIIHETKMYPVTVLSSLTGAEKTRLLAMNAPLCHTVMDNPETLRRAGVPEKRLRNVIEESTALCGIT